MPYGRGEEVDKRRGGTWYLGIQALDTVAEYTIRTSYEEPQSVVQLACTRLSHYCPSAFGRYATSGGAASAKRAWSHLGLPLWVAVGTSAALLLSTASGALRHRGGGGPDRQGRCHSDRSWRSGRFVERMSCPR